MSFSFPASLDAGLLADDAFLRAYDALVPDERAAVKTAIARIAAVCGRRETLSYRYAESLRQGFRMHGSSRPASWAVVLWDEAYAGPGRVLAALVPAMLAGTPHIMACRINRGGSPFPAPLLAAMELAGQELVAEACPEDAADFVARCCDADPRGRLVLLGRDPVFERIGHLAAEHGTPLLRYAAPVRIGLAAASFTKPASHEFLCFAQPDAALVPFEDDAPQGAFSAIFCAKEAVPAYLDAAPLVLSPGNEAWWLWPGLGPDFFQETGLGICTEPL